MLIETYSELESEPKLDPHRSLSDYDFLRLDHFFVLLRLHSAPEKRSPSRRRDLSAYNGGSDRNLGLARTSGGVFGSFD